MVKRDQSFPDPTQFKNEKQFLYAALCASVYKKVVAELVSYLEVEIPARVKFLSDKKAGKLEDKFAIGK